LRYNVSMKRKIRFKEKGMKTIGVLFSVWFFGMLLTGSGWAADPLKIGYVDMQRALNQCEAGQEAKKVITGEVEKIQKTMEAKQKELNRLREDLEKRGSVMNETVRREKEKDFQNKTRDVQRMQRDFEDDLRRKDREFTDRVLRELAMIARKIGEEGKYTLILEGNQPAIVFISKALDLTDEVIKQANSQKSK
jgi:outer membrane protein